MVHPWLLALFLPACIENIAPQDTVIISRPTRAYENERTYFDETKRFQIKSYGANQQNNNEDDDPTKLSN